MTTGSIYKVQFTEPPLADDDRTEFYFTSLSAIYETLTPEQVGCGVKRLWNLQISQGNPYHGKRCVITKQQINSKTQNNPCKGRSDEK